MGTDHCFFGPLWKRSHQIHKNPLSAAFQASETGRDFSNDLRFPMIAVPVYYQYSDEVYVFRRACVVLHTEPSNHSFELQLTGFLKTPNSCVQLEFVPRSRRSFEWHFIHPTNLLRISRLGFLSCRLDFMKSSQLDGTTLSYVRFLLILMGRPPDRPWLGRQVYLPNLPGARNDWIAAFRTVPWPSFPVAG